MILLVVWDGLRPDMIRDELTPHLARRSRQGVMCMRSHAVWPSATRINSSALSTGCYPGRHGLVDNELYVPALDPAEPISCADSRALQAMAQAEGGRLLTAPTLGEVLQQHGRQMISGGSGSPGTTLLTNPTLTGPIINWAVAWPEPFAEEITTTFGPFLPEASSSIERNRYVIGALCETMIPRYRPDVVTLWLTEPDHAQHGYGLLSPEARDMLAHVDDEIQTLIEHLAAQDSDLTVFDLSDHGFETITGPLPIAEGLIEAGLKDAKDSTDVVLTLSNIYLSDEALPRAPRICAWLLEQPWIGGVFARDDLFDICPGTLPQSAVGGGHARSAAIMYSPGWTHECNDVGVPGTVYRGEGGSVATHGSTSPYTLNNTLVAWGAGIKQGVRSTVPCGIVDIAPTVLHLLGIKAPAWDGRVLHELLASGLQPSEVAVCESTRETTLNGHRQVAYYSHADGGLDTATYLDRVEVITDDE